MNTPVNKSLQIKEITPMQSLGEAHFFNSSDFLQHKGFAVKGFQLLKNGAPLTQIFFYINNGIAISGYRATFGSFDISTELGNNALVYFIENIIDALKKTGVRRIDVKNPPAYFGAVHQIEKCLLEVGFKSQTTELNQHININENPFLERVKRNVRKKINQCIRAEFTFEIDLNSNISEIYDLVVDTRNRKDYEVSMTLAALSSAINSCPENYILFTLRDGDKLIAASVSVLINSTVLYNFYHADDFNYRSQSPLSLLLMHIYAYCQQHKLAVLDLGTSSLNEELNEGLFRFKENLGAVTSDKKTFRLLL